MAAMVLHIRCIYVFHSESSSKILLEQSSTIPKLPDGGICIINNYAFQILKRLGGELGCTTKTFVS